AAVAEPLTNLGRLYKKLGKYNLAEPYYLRANAILKSSLGEKSARVADTFSELGILYFLMADYEKSKVSFEKAIAVMEEALDPSHPRMEGVLADYALVLEKQGKRAEMETIRIRIDKLKEGMAVRNASRDNLAAQDPEIYMLLDAIRHENTDQVRK